MSPVRVQRQRTKGWRMPENTVYVGRGSKWGNPFAVGKPAPDPIVGVCTREGFRLFLNDYPTWVKNREDARRRFAYLLVEPFINRTEYPEYPTASEVQAELAGKNLACWCPLDAPCHADVLLDIANPKENQ